MLSQEIERVKQDSRVDIHKFGNIYESIRQDVAFCPATNSFGRASLQSAKDRISEFHAEIKSLRNIMGQEHKKAAKLEKRLKVALGGYRVCSPLFVGLITI